MEHSPFVRRLLQGVLIFLGLTALFFWVVHDDWSETAVSLPSVSRGDIVSAPAGASVYQSFSPGMDAVTSLALDVHPLSANAEGTIHLSLAAPDKMIWEKDIPVSMLSENGMTAIPLEQAVTLSSGSSLTLGILSDVDLLLWRGNSQNTGRIDIPVENIGQLSMDSVPLNGNLVMLVEGKHYLQSARFYLPVMFCLGAALLALSLYVHACSVHGHSNLILRILQTARRYRFLLKTLVARDFKIKYRSSLLGFVWSGLHPLMMMGLYYIVFSTIFRSSVKNFPVYLITGIVIFNYFGDATTLGMQAIIGNAGLINKVYLPKYIYPLSKTVSSSLNLGISTIVLLLVMLFSRAPFGKALLLIPVFLVLLILFCSGIAMILSAWIVFFRDVQFLWSVALTALNFFTPIFYAESIIPHGWWTTVFHANPLYQFITAMRRITLEGLAPLPVNLICCIAWSVFSIGLGLWIFKKHQDQFVLYL
ncbi:MAG: ABC transporter permease [Clostridia bacterium]|nr:ABC transporter permease [Clostridia bacterium]